jgi:hypothetical protein
VDYCRPERNDALVSYYEQLRGDALASSVGHPSATGLALFNRQGMAAWMRAWSQCTQEADSQEISQPPIREPLPLELRTQIATLLAGIIMAVH